MTFDSTALRTASFEPMASWGSTVYGNAEVDKGKSAFVALDLVTGKRTVLGKPVSSEASVAVSAGRVAWAEGPDTGCSDESMPWRIWTLGKAGEAPRLLASGTSYDTGMCFVVPPQIALDQDRLAYANVDDHGATMAVLSVSTGRRIRTLVLHDGAWGIGLSGRAIAYEHGDSKLILAEKDSMAPHEVDGAVAGFALRDGRLAWTHMEGTDDSACSTWTMALDRGTAVRLPDVPGVVVGPAWGCPSLAVSRDVVAWVTGPAVSESGEVDNERAAGIAIWTAAGGRTLLVPMAGRLSLVNLSDGWLVWSAPPPEGSASETTVVYGLPLSALRFPAA